MQVNVEATSNLERRVRIVVPSEQVETAVADRLKQAASSARIKGFRPGKVPMREIKRRFGPGIRQEVSGELMQSSYAQAIQQENLNPAGFPIIEEISNDSGKDLEFTAVIEVFPEFDVASFGQIKVEKPVAAVTDADIDKMIETLRKQQVTWNEVTRASKLDDKVKVDFEGFVDDEPFEGGQVEGGEVILGSNSMIPGFEEGLTGCRAGDERTLELTFPDPYHSEALAGKDARFVVKIHSVAEPVLPELDAEFFRRYGVEDADLEKFRAEVRGNMEQELETAVRTRLKNSVMQGLVDTNELELPQAMVNSEIDRMRQEAVRQFAGLNAEKLDASMLPREMFSAQAERRVKLGLVVGEIMKREPMEADPDRVRATIEKMAAPYEEPEQVINWYYSNQEQLDQIQNLVLEEQLVERIVAQAQVTEVELSYEEAIRRPDPVDEASDGGDAPAEETSDTDA